VFGFLMSAALAVATPEAPGRGVSEALARERATAIANLRYELAFTVPASRSEPVRGRVMIRFALRGSRPVVLDFGGPAERVLAVSVNGRDTRYIVTDDHLSLPAAAFGRGEQEVVVEFVAADEPLNRSDDFLYSLFVPARAHLVFPCFDQPDLKARYSMSLDIPAGWQAVANGRSARGETSEGRTRIRFEQTKPLPTYLVSFAAGKFSVETATRAGRELRMFHRETDSSKVARNREAIFDLHASALEWLERYTGIGYPFGKFDFVLIPAFQFGGMEHPGAILYNAASLLLEESATQNQRLNRASLIAHETSHMWFGDLVTMRWFDDVWMKEVFANFIAAKIVNPAFPGVNHDLRFLLAHYPEAYDVDRTPGTNPIRQPLANLDDAGQLYGPIIYQKAPIVMRQLELMLGERALREGLRAYLRRYAYRNATWLDLVTMLDAGTETNLAEWSRTWVEERGRPEFRTNLIIGGDNRVSQLGLEVSDPLQRGFVWPQRLRVALGYPGRVEEMPAEVAGPVTTVAGARGMDRPLYVLPGGGGLGYGLFILDDASRTYLEAHLEDIPDALTRGSAWVTMWDNLLESRMSTAAFIDLVMRALPREPDEQNAQRVLGYLARAFWQFLPDAERMARAPALESMLRAGIDRSGTSSQKAAWFVTFRDVARTAEGVAWLERVWRREERIPGLTFAETDEIAMALELAVRDVPGARDILQQQLDRTENPDRRARLAFVLPSLSGDPAVREQAFERLRNLENRRREPWVLESLQYLHHPLREAHARQFIRPSLDLLREIQRTGDIFFPARWLDATLRGHRSREAAAIVQDFLAGEVEYPVRLRWTLLSVADDLFRAVALAGAD
jgi:aminopeptidase N